MSLDPAIRVLLGLCLTLAFAQCKKTPALEHGWQRDASNPVHRDRDQEENYDIASDPHVYYHDEELYMIYSGPLGITIAKGSDWDQWEFHKSILDQAGPNGLYAFKETAFYRRTNDGLHQVYFIGYPEEETYEAQVFLAEASSIDGPYTIYDEPVVAVGELAGEQVHCITSPSVVEHDSVLYLSFIGWDAAPAEVTEVWVMGATSLDDGRTWSSPELVDAPIGMEGQITADPSGGFVGVRTAEYEDTEGIYLSRGDHPFGPWTEEPDPILVKAGRPWEKHEIIAPQITFDDESGEMHLFYTGANHLRGWWVMHATPPQ